MPHGHWASVHQLTDLLHYASYLLPCLQVSVLDHKQSEVTVEARISTTNGPAAQHEEAISCGDFFVSVGDDACSNWYYQI